MGTNTIKSVPGVTEKRCSMCATVKPFSEFYKDRSSPTGLQSRCGQCQREVQVAKRASDLTSARARGRERYAKNPDYFRRYVASYARRNAEQLRAKRLDVYASDPERYRARARNWRARNIDKATIRLTKWRDSHREYMRAYDRRKRAEYLLNGKSWEMCARRRARIRSAPVIERISRSAIIQRDGARCYLCGRELTLREVTLDHVIPLARGGSHTADNLRVACRPCNSRKGARLVT